MQKFEKICGIIILISWSLKLFDLPMSPIFVFTSLILTVFYFIFTFPLINDFTFKRIFTKDSYKNIGALRSIGLIALGIGLSLTVLGNVFLSQNWIGGLSNLISGVMILFILAIFSIIKRRESTDKHFYNKILIRITIWLIFSSIIIIISDKIYL